MFGTALLVLAGAEAIRTASAADTTITVVPAPVTSTVYAELPTEVPSTTTSSSDSSSSAPGTITVTVVPEPITSTVLKTSSDCLPTTATITDYSPTTSYLTTTYSTSYPVTVTSNHTAWTTDTTTYSASYPVTVTSNHTAWTTDTTTYSTSYPVTVTSNHTVWKTNTLTVTTPVTELPSEVPTTTTVTDYSSIISNITTTHSASYPVTVTRNHTIWTTDTLTVTTPVTLTATSTFATSVTSSTTTTTAPSKPTQTWSFQVPLWVPTRGTICQDWKRHSPGEMDEPWAIYLMQNSILYGENVRAMAKHCIKSMDLFKQYGDAYLDFMRYHPDHLDPTLEVVNDVDCMIKGVPTVYDELDPPNETLMGWRRKLELFLWGEFKPRQLYEETIPKLLEQLKGIKEKPVSQG